MPDYQNSYYRTSEQLKKVYESIRHVGGMMKFALTKLGELEHIVSLSPHGSVKEINVRPKNPLDPIRAETLKEYANRIRQYFIEQMLKSRGR